MEQLSNIFLNMAVIVDYVIELFADQGVHKLY